MDDKVKKLIEKVSEEKTAVINELVSYCKNQSQTYGEARDMMFKLEKQVQWKGDSFSKNIVREAHQSLQKEMDGILIGEGNKHA
ncbi:hypothetical protein [Halobacillus karajensis]|uniref:hypothetical protein n=1 Tax=Halobacillus karajensis TaxID=195088 RepID=UPI00045D1F49|nr:hypothetical protein [Halobacillus karajensis]CDQ17975.1 hypothetical protein BN982_00215 [Halobacillus karajensis]